MGFVEYYNYSFEELISLLKTDKTASTNEILTQYDLKQIFDGFKQRGVKDFKYLRKRLRKNEGIRHYAKALGVSEEYLITLRNHLNSFVPKAKPLKQLPFVDKNTHSLFLKTLKVMGITNTFHIIHACRTIKRRTGVLKVSGLPEQFLSQLVEFSDLFRCNNMQNHLSVLLIEEQINSSQKLANTEPHLLYEQINTRNSSQKSKKKIPSKEIFYLIVVQAKRSIERLMVEY